MTTMGRIAWCVARAHSPCSARGLLAKSAKLPAPAGAKRHSRHGGPSDRVGRGRGERLAGRRERTMPGRAMTTTAREMLARASGEDAD
jgi:hypothetical protein